MSSNGPRVAAKDRAYAFTKQRVLNSTYAGGELLSEGEVADALGMSRTPVREAFLRLEAEGLLRLYPKRGALVVPVSAHEAEALMETRLVVERFALEKTMRRGVEVADRMDAAIGRQEACAAKGDEAGFVEADREFHTTFVAAAGNAIISSLYESLRDRQMRVIIASLARDARRMGEILEQHRELSASIRSGDVDEALRILDYHLRGTLVLLLMGEHAPAPK